MLLQRFYDIKLAQASYMIGCQATGEAVVIDPHRDTDIYLRAAKEEGMEIAYVSETHIHADYLSGSRQLAEQTGAELVLSGHGDETWRYGFVEEVGARLVQDGDRITLGNVTIEVLHTPGHTAGGISLVMGSHLFSGDTLFPGGPGRTGSPQDFRQIQDSISTKLLALPDDTPVYPGHGVDTTIGKARLEYQNFISRKHPENLFGEIVWSKT